MVQVQFAFTVRVPGPLIIPAMVKSLLRVRCPVPEIVVVLFKVMPDASTRSILRFNRPLFEMVPVPEIVEPELWLKVPTPCIANVPPVKLIAFVLLKAVGTDAPKENIPPFRFIVPLLSIVVIFANIVVPVLVLVIVPVLEKSDNVVPFANVLLPPISHVPLLVIVLAPLF